MESNRKHITLGILAHVDAGKTTLSEALLYRTGAIRKLGRVDHGDSFLDDAVIEKNRGITVFSRQARFVISPAEGRTETSVTLIDTPGHVDFSAETERTLSVLDYALIVISGSEGVQAHTGTLYKMLKDRGIPVFIFVNKTDITVRQGPELLRELKSELDECIVDFGGAAGRTADFTDDVTLYSARLAEMVLDGAEPADDDISDAVADREIVPCMFGSALKLEGIDELLDVLARYTREPEYGREFGAKVFKISNTEDGERLSYIKVTGGSLRVKDKVTVNHAAGEAAGSEEKVNQIRLYSGSRYVTAESAAAGTVCAVTGLRGALPGDALGSEEPLSGRFVMPYMEYSVTGPEGMDPYLLKRDLDILAEEDPVLNVAKRADGSIGIRIMGQVQLEVLTDVIRERFGYAVSFESGSVLYLETIKDTYEGVGHFEPLRHYAEVHLVLEPGERGSGTVITSEVPEDELSLNWQRLILTHIEEKEHRGVLIGAPVTDIKISLAAGRAHDKHTNGGDFREATYRAVRNALMQARADSNAVLLEPWCVYEITLPSRFVGRAMTDIRQMGGSQDCLEQQGDVSTVKGRVPASEIAAYQQILTAYTSGEGRLSCSPAGYDVCHDAAAVIERSAYDPERDTDNPADSVFVNHSGSDIVKWDEVPGRMHLGSVLKRKTTEGTEAYDHTEDLMKSANEPGIDAREAAKRRMAAEKELRRIFERTYGEIKQTRRREATETDYRKRPAITEEEAARNAERSRAIKERHEHRKGEDRSKPVMILIDGYNLIFADQYMKELSERDMGSAREHLIEKLCNYAGYTGFEVAVIFDAYNVPEGTGREEDQNGIKIIFTAMNEPADIRIGTMTDQNRDRCIYAVTSDTLVQQDVWTHGALRVSSAEFLTELERTEEEIRGRL